jgi:hypothetical protein
MCKQKKPALQEAEDKHEAWKHAKLLFKHCEGTALEKRAAMHLNTA